MEDRIESGGTIGYIILILLAIGLLIAVERFIVLAAIGAKVKRQAKNVDNPR